MTCRHMWIVGANRRSEYTSFNYNLRELINLVCANCGAIREPKPLEKHLFTAGARAQNESRGE
jgi:hypothetical protein